MSLKRPIVYTQMKLFILCAALLVPTAQTLMPSRLPNGEVRRYVVNKEAPSSDLFAVERKEACIIAKHWMNNIAVQPEVPQEDAHIVERIDRLCDFAESDEDERNVYLVWMPKGVMRDVLFITIINVGVHLTVCLLVPSPYWDSTQIDSHKLKEALHHLACESGYSLDLTFLYKNDVRYKLAWSDVH